MITCPQCKRTLEVGERFYREEWEEWEVTPYSTPYGFTQGDSLDVNTPVPARWMCIRCAPGHILRAVKARDEASA